MRIKTITCHDVYNAGASLQAYALVTYLRSLGHEVEIIDYKPDYLSNHYPLWGLNNSAFDKPIVRELYNLAKLPGRIKARYSKRKVSFDAFRKEFLPITKRRYTSNEELKRDPPQADVYFAGSDQIWNCFFRNGKDPAFYLDFAPAGAVKASYAASFATEDVAEEWKPQVRQWLSGLDYISVRESSGVEIIEHLGIPNSVQVLDPVFLLNREMWTAIEKLPERTEPYVLLYDCDRNPKMVQFARDLAKEHGWMLYSVLPCEKCDRCFGQEGPQTFVGLVHNAEFVVSNSFHATAFSLIFQKQFVVFNRSESINTRMRDILKLVGAMNRLITDPDQELQRIHYDEIEKKLNRAIQNSKKYIAEVLEEKAND